VESNLLLIFRGRKEGRNIRGNCETKVFRVWSAIQKKGRFVCIHSDPFDFEGRGEGGKEKEGWKRFLGWKIEACRRKGD